VKLPAGRPEWPAVLDAKLAAQVALIAQSACAGAAGGADALEAAREALLRGALDVA